MRKIGLILIAAILGYYAGAYYGARIKDLTTRSKSSDKSEIGGYR